MKYETTGGPGKFSVHSSPQYDDFIKGIWRGKVHRGLKSKRGGDLEITFHRGHQRGEEFFSEGSEVHWTGSQIATLEAVPSGWLITFGGPWTMLDIMRPRETVLWIIKWRGEVLDTALVKLGPEYWDPVLVDEVRLQYRVRIGFIPLRFRLYRDYWRARNYFRKKLGGVLKWPRTD